MVIIITEEKKENVSNPSDWTTKPLNVEKRENADWLIKGLTQTSVIQKSRKTKGKDAN